MTIPRANILGVGVSTTNMEMAARTIEAWMVRRAPHFVCGIDCLVLAVEIQPPLGDLVLSPAVLLEVAGLEMSSFSPGFG
jgi:hypothetical protein